MSEVFEISDFTTTSDWERFVADLEEIITKWRLRPQHPTQQSIRFARIPFSVTYYPTVPELEDDFPPKAHPIVRWFGVRDFVLISPSEETITTEDRSALLMSSVALAVTNTGTAVPVFCELSARGRHVFAGVGGVSGVPTQRLVFSSIHLNSIPNSLRFLSQFLTIFKQKIETNCQSIVKYAIKLTHAVNQWPPDWTLTADRHFGPFFLISGPEEEPVLEVQMAAIWPEVSEEVIMDSEVHSDLVPNSAPLWSLRAVFRDVFGALSHSLDLLSGLEGNEEVLAEVEEPEVRHTLDRIGSSRPVFRLDDFLDGVFGSVTSDQTLEDREFGCLCWRISVSFSNIFYVFKEISFLARFWKRIVERVRLSWESGVLLPHLTAGGPDQRACLLHQKLQMINECIEEKRRLNDENNEDNSDDEFFECNEEVEASDGSAFGRLSRTEMTLLGHPEEPLFVPITQRPTPMTEDMVAEHLAVLSELGTCPQSRELRARMQSQSLVSDMSAFKRANPKCCFEDFVRWHSPRDYSEGHLSSRFQSSDNVWRHLWDSAEPVAAKHQKKIFDENKEAEKVLHWLRALTVREVISLMLPTVITCQKSMVAKQLKNECFERDLREKEIFLNRFQSLEKKFKICAKMAANEGIGSEDQIHDIVRRLLVEPEVRFPSFGRLAEIIKKMFFEIQMYLESEKPVGERVGHVSPWPTPVAKEFILRTHSRRPNPYSAECPQRMYALLSEKEFRICGLFSEEMVF